jgi:hypothetical protein
MEARHGCAATTSARRPRGVVLCLDKIRRRIGIRYAMEVGRYWGDEKWGEGWGWANFWTDLDLMLIDLSVGWRYHRDETIVSPDGD